MASLKEFLAIRKQQEKRTFVRVAKSDQERAVSMAVEYTITAIEKELESVQLEWLYKIEANVNAMQDYAAENWNREYFYKIDLGIMIAYRRIFGTEEYDKLMSGEGMKKELDLNKIKDVIKEAKK